MFLESLGDCHFILAAELTHFTYKPDLKTNLFVSFLPFRDLKAHFKSELSPGETLSMTRAQLRCSTTLMSLPSLQSAPAASMPELLQG